jgi:hypothetical protein
MRVLKREFPKGLRIFRNQQGNVRAIAGEGTAYKLYKLFNEGPKFDVPGRLQSQSA